MLIFYIYLPMYVKFFGHVFTSCLICDKQGDAGERQKNTRDNQRTLPNKKSYLTAAVITSYDDKNVTQYRTNPL
jgi:hypothetical protein